MSSNNEKFIKIVEDAEQIADTLIKLQEEINSYNSAGQALEKVREDLKVFVSSAKEASKGLLSLSNGIGDRIDDSINTTIELKKMVEQEFLKTNKIIQTNGELNIVNVNEKTQKHTEQAISYLEGRMSNLKKLIYIAIAISMLSMIIGFLF